jgi:hypothetical protein
MTVGLGGPYQCQNTVSHGPRAMGAKVSDKLEESAVLAYDAPPPPDGRGF